MSGRWHVRVPSRFFVSKCLRFGQFSSEMLIDVSEAFNCCASSDDSGTPSPPSQASLDECSSYSRALQKRPSGPSTQMEERRTPKQSQKRPSGRGITSRRHVLSTASSASPSCWTLMSRSSCATVPCVPWQEENFTSKLSNIS